MCSPEHCAICGLSAIFEHLSLDDRPGIDPVCAGCFAWMWVWAERRGW